MDHVAQEECRHGLQITVCHLEGGEGLSEDTQGGEAVRADLHLGEVEGLQGFEGEEVVLEMVGDDVARADTGLITCGNQGF